MESSVEPLRLALQTTAKQLGVNVTEVQTDALLNYLALLLRWNLHYNLTAVRETSLMLTQHIADCLGVIGPLRRQVDRSGSRVLDVGSGGGLPGIVIAILDPAIDVMCIDSVGKKTAFVQQVAVELGLRNIGMRHARVQDVAMGKFDVVTSRAFASLQNFTQVSFRHLSESGSWMAMKGRLPAKELADLPVGIDTFHVEHLVIPGLDAERCLVWMRPRR